LRFATTHTTNSLTAFSAYRFHFNGKETDNEVYGAGNVYDYGFRIYNPRLGKFLSVDPLTKSYPWYTPYQFAGNKPIAAIDLDGLEEYYTSSGELIGKYGTSTEIRIVYDNYVEVARQIITTQNEPSSNVMNDILFNKYSAGVHNNPDDAAADWGMRYNQYSIENNVEMISVIFVTKINDKPVFSYSQPNKGDESSSETKATSTSKRRVIATIHSHGKFLETHDNNVFSEDFIDANGEVVKGDIDSDNDLNLIGYITTPNGSLQKHVPFVEPITLSCDMPSDPKDPTSDPNKIIPSTPPKIN
jgi:RHS repeat-associated protein